MSPYIRAICCTVCIIPLMIACTKKGSTGSNGADALSSLTELSPEPVGINCRNGGQRIDSGVDTNSNGSLDPAEITHTGFVCSGTDSSIGWQVATLIELNNVAGALNPQVSVDGSGNAVAVWQQSNSIWANRYVVDKGWGTAVEIGNGNSINPPQVSVDSSGNAVAVWAQWDNSEWSIWASHYLVGTGWSIAQKIETNADFASSPQVSVDDSGNAVAVWQQGDPRLVGDRHIWANRYVVGTGWGSAEVVESNAGDSWFPQVSVDSSGNAVAVWQQSDSIWANRYVVGTGWGTAVEIESKAGAASIPQISVDGSGNAMAVWPQIDGTRSVWANRYVVGAGWGTAELIESNAGTVSSPQVSVDGSGNAVAVWQEHDGDRDNIWANSYVVGTGWGTAKLIETVNTRDAEAPQVSVDGSGNAVAVWQQHDDTHYNIWANRYIVGLGWGTAELIEVDTSGSASNPQVSVNGNGHVTAVWFQSDGTRDNIWANRRLTQ